MAEDDLEDRHELHHHHHDHDDDHDDDHDHDDFESFIISRGEIDNPEEFSKLILDVIRDHDILRLKGFVAVNGKPLRLTIQAVGPRIETYF